MAVGFIFLGRIAYHFLKGKPYSRSGISLALAFFSCKPLPVAPWWLDRIVLPIVFLVIGACLGRLKDWFDDRKARRAFLAAIRVELSEMQGHLAGTLTDIEAAKASLGSPDQHALHLATVFQTGVYSAQVGKIKDVRDSRVTDIIRFYDRLANLERVKSRATALSYELPTLSNSDTERTQFLAMEYARSLDEVVRRINLLLPEVEALIKKLPTA